MNLIKEKTKCSVANNIKEFLKSIDAELLRESDDHELSHWILHENGFDLDIDILHNRNAMCFLNYESKIKIETFFYYIKTDVNELINDFNKILNICNEKIQFVDEINEKLNGFETNIEPYILKKEYKYKGTKLIIAIELHYLDESKNLVLISYENPYTNYINNTIIDKKMSYEEFKNYDIYNNDKIKEVTDFLIKKYQFQL